MTTAVEAPAVRAGKITRRYGDRTVLHELDLEIRRGEFVALIGKSGCGKTTLLRTLAGLDCLDGGELAVPSSSTVVFQEHRLLPWEKVWRNVSLNLPRATARARAQSALEEVGLGDHADVWPVTLSGGEAQRVALARALVREPELLLLDEPFAALDALTRIKMHGLVRDLIARHRPAVLLVTHDVDESIVLADRVIVLDEGRLVTEEVIDLEPPRSPADPRVAEVRTRLLTALGVEAHL